MKKTVQAPARRPVARPVAVAPAVQASAAAPAKPGKPIGKPALSAPATPTVTPKPGKPVVSAPTATVSPDQIAAMAAQIEALTKQLAKVKEKPANVRTLSDILTGIKLEKDDWRGEYHGIVLHLFPHDVTSKGLEVATDKAPIPCLLAMPRDNDLGGKGMKARGQGMIAVHWERNEAGEFSGNGPSYITLEELGQCWPEGEEARHAKGFDPETMTVSAK